MIIVATNAVDVSTISAAGVDALGIPLELAGRRCPCSVDSVGTAGGVLFAIINGEEQELIGTTVGADIGAIR